MMLTNLITYDEYNILVTGFHYIQQYSKKVNTIVVIMAQLIKLKSSSFK